MSSLFPQLPPRSRTQFRVGLAAAGIAVLAFAVLRWQAAVVAAAIFGLPIVFAVYLHEIGVRRSPMGRYFVLSAILALGLGVGWALVAGPIVADAYSAALGGRLSAGQLLLCGIAIPATFGLVMIAPAALVWLVDRSPGESLDGFTIGAVGATVANAAVTATLLAPQLAMGVTASDHSVGGLVAQALVEGVTWPLGAVAVGGVFGIAMWFTPADGAPSRLRRRVVVLGAVLGAEAFCMAVGVVDVAPIPTSIYIALQLLIAVTAVLAVRIVITEALLHEKTDDLAGQHFSCAECGRPVERAFCGECGAATRAVAPGLRTATQEPLASYRHVLVPMIGGVAAAVLATVGVATLIQPTPPAFVCPPDCGRPPLGDPVETNPRFSGDNGAFSVAYPSSGAAYEVTFDPPGINGVQLKYTGGDTGMLMLFGEPAGGRTAKQVALEVMAARYPRATVAYEIPNASVGYEPGFGVAADIYPRDSSSAYARLRVIVMAAIRHDYALIATAAGPYHEFSPDYGTGHPSGANLEVAMDMGKYVNSFRWNGDRYERPS